MPVAESARPRVGVLGLEAQHVFNGAVRLNTPLHGNWPETGDFPRYRVRRIPGLHSLAETDGNEGRSRMGQIGEKQTPDLARGKTVTYEGEIQALSLPDLRLATDNLRAAFSDHRSEFVMRVEPHPDSPLGKTMTYRAKVMGLDVDEDQTYRQNHVPSPFCRPFTLSLRQGDPRYYDAVPSTADAAWDATAGRAQLASVANPGSAPTDPVFRVTGPTNGDWRLDYAGAPARFLGVSGIALAAGQHVDVDFVQRSIRRNDGVDMSGAVTQASSWWDEGVYGLDPRSSAAVTLTMGTGGLRSPGALDANTSLVSGSTLAAATWIYRVTALNAAGETLPSSELHVVVGTDVYGPRNGSLFHYHLGKTNEATLRWGEVPGATGYRVYRRQQGTAQESIDVGNVRELRDTGGLVWTARTVPTTNTASSGAAGAGTALRGTWTPAHY